MSPFPPAVGIKNGLAVYDHLGQESVAGAINIPLVTEERQATVVPPRAQPRANRVVPRLQEVPDIVGLICETVFVSGPTGSQDLIADASAVDLELVYTVGCDVDTGMPTHSGRADIESGPHEKRALWRFDVVWHRAADNSNISPLVPVEYTSLDVGTGPLNDAAIVTERLDRDVNLFPTPERPREWPGDATDRSSIEPSCLKSLAL